MNKRDLGKLITAHRIRGEKTIEALHLVMVDGMTAYQAGKQVALNESTISRAKDRIERPLCPHCGQPMPKKVKK